MPNENGKQVAIEELRRRVNVLESKMDSVQNQLVAIKTSQNYMKELLEKIDIKLDKREEYCRITTEKIEKRLDAEEKESNLASWLRKHAVSILLGIMLAGVGALITWLATYLPGG